MRAIAGTMRVPNQAIESGRLEGDVEIRIYEPSVDGVDAPLEDRAPAVTIEAESAVYDAAAGEIHSPRAVRVTTSEATFAGEDLRILFEGDGTRISRLTVERATEPILIRPGRRTPPIAAASTRAPGSTKGKVPAAAAEAASAADAWSERDSDVVAGANVNRSTSPSTSSSTVSRNDSQNLMPL